MTAPDTLVRTAIEAVTRACRVARSVQSHLADLQQITKEDRSPVTVADFAVQAIVCLELTKALGPVPIVGEETAEVLRNPTARTVRDAVVQAVQSLQPNVDSDQILDAIDACGHDGRADVFWTLDPIDGTKGFLRGQQYAIALARIEGGRVTHGIMGCPNLSVDPQRAVEAADPIGVVFSASDGGGAWQWPTNGTDREGQPIHAKSGPADVARICSSVERSHSSQDDQQRVLEHLGLRVEPLRLDSQGKYGIVARGQADAYLRLPTRASYVERIWDHAAGSLIATEAGAVVSDITGATLDFSHGSGLEANRGVVCANRSLHGRLIEALRDLNIASPV